MEIDLLRKFTCVFARAQVKFPFLILGGVIAFTLIIFPGLGLVYTDQSNENFLPEDDPVVESLFLVASDFSGSNFQTVQLLFFIDKEETGEIVDLRDGRFLRKLDLITASLLELEYVDAVNTPTTEIKRLNNGTIPEDLEKIKTIMQENPALKDAYNSDYSIMRITVVGSSFGTTAQSAKNVLDEITGHVEGVGLPEGITHSVWGSLLQFIEFDQNFQEGFGLTSALAFIAIFVLVVLFFRSLISGLLAIIPIGIAIIWTIGTMGYINLPFTMVTTGFIPIVVGFGIDFSIHLIHNIKHLQKQGEKIEEAILESMEEVGEAIFGSTITISIGFLSLILGSLLVTQRLGITLTLSVLYIFLSCIIIVPTVLLLQEKFFKRRGIRKFLPGGIK